MPQQAISDFLAGPAMTRLMNSQAIRRGVPNFLPKPLTEYSSARPVGMEVQWDEVRGNRQLAQLVHHTAPSRRAELPGVTRRFATALGSREHFVLDTEFLMKLKSDQALVAEGARRHLVQKMADFRSRFDNLQVSLVNSAFAKGAIYADVNGNVLPSSTGASVTVDFGLTKTFVKTDTIDGTTVGDFSVATTDIFATMRSVRNDSVKTSNYNPVHVLYGKNIPSYFAANTSLQAFLSRNPKWGDQLLSTNEVPDGMLDYVWHPTYSSYFVDAAGVTQKWFGDDDMIIFPEVTEDWYEYVPAGTLIPNGIGQPGVSIDEALDRCQVVNGFFSYCEALQVDPIQVKCLGGWYGLPIIKNPLVVYKLTVK
jgi:hypothetical protein